jgi:hypothetical protein
LQLEEEKDFILRGARIFQPFKKFDDPGPIL